MNKLKICQNSNDSSSFYQHTKRRNKFSVEINGKNKLCTFSATAFVYAKPISIEASFTSFIFVQRTQPYHCNHTTAFYKIFERIRLWTSPRSAAKKTKKKSLMISFTKSVFICPMSILHGVKQSDQWCDGNNDALVIWWIERHKDWIGICNVSFRWLPLTVLVLRHLCAFHICHSYMPPISRTLGPISFENSKTMDIRFDIKKGTKIIQKIGLACVVHILLKNIANIKLG